MIEATSCGGVVIYRGKILTLYKSYKHKYEGWVLPKGTVEEGEDYKDTALREVKEEAGVTATIMKYVGKSQYSFCIPEDTVEKEVYWYLMSAGSYFSRPQKEEYFVDSGFYKFHEAIAAKAGEFNKIIQKGTAIVDVGFGSAQLSLFDKDSLVTTQNLPLGTLRVRGLLANIPATVAEHREHIEEIVDNELFTFRKMYLKDREINNLIGIGENILYIINRMDLKAYGDRIDAAAMNRFYERLCQMTTDQIEEKFGVNSEYASLLLPSVVVYKRILELTGADMFWVPGIRLCDGIAAEYAQANKLVRFSHNFENDILAASRNMAKRYKCHTSHNQVLEQYALGIFDSMKKYHGLGARERLLLQISVLLHACGKFISIKNSNECSYNIIMSTEIIGLSHLEREIIANVVRYNIRDFDYDKVQLETQIHQEDMPGYSRNAITILIAKLTAILRLANSMDRSHRGKLADCRMAVRDNELIITTGYQGNMALETASFEQKADFFEEIFGVRPVLKQKRRV